MNTKILKSLGIAITIGFVFTLIGYLLAEKNTTHQIGRQIAHENLNSVELSEGQKLKWATTEQFMVKQTNESIMLDIPHISDLCTENQTITFQFSAYEISIAGENPKLQYTISCELASEQTHFEVLFSDLISLQKLKELSRPDGTLKSFLIYSDESLPERWNLTEIAIGGAHQFKINQFEIQKVFGHNFEFELRL